MAGAAASAPGPELGDLRLPKGRSLPFEAWQRRHRVILLLLGLHAVGLALFGVYMEASLAHSLLEGGVIGGLMLVAMQPRLSRRARSIVAALGLMSSSAVLTHLSGGYIEAHFHFFVMLGVIFLYEDWLPYACAVAYVAVHHGTIGTIDPLSVYNHPSAISDPWQWALIHAFFILGLSGALIVGWNAIEQARYAETRALSEAQNLKRQLHTQEKMAALGSLISGLAHEVRTPLTVIGTSASLLRRAAERDPQHALSANVLEQTTEIDASVDRINALVHQLRKFHALPHDGMQVVEFDAVVREAMRLFHFANAGAGRVQLDLKAVPPAPLHPLGIQQIVLNLVANAVEATDPATGSVTVRAMSERGYAVLQVEDNGAGMDDATIRRIFDPLFSTKPEGMGLGLDIVRRIVEAHGGTIDVASRRGGGTRFDVRLPLHLPVAPLPAAVDTDGNGDDLLQRAAAHSSTR